MSSAKWNNVALHELQAETTGEMLSGDSTPGGY